MLQIAHRRGAITDGLEVLVGNPVFLPRRSTTERRQVDILNHLAISKTLRQTLTEPGIRSVDLVENAGIVKQVDDLIECGVCVPGTVTSDIAYRPGKGLEKFVVDIALGQSDRSCSQRVALKHFRNPCRCADRIEDLFGSQ